MGRTLSAKQVLTLKRRTIRPGGIWADCVGEIDRTGVVFFWGNSGNGKTSAVASFCKELTQFGRVLYLPLEEGWAARRRTPSAAIGWTSAAGSSSTTRR